MHPIVALLLATSAAQAPAPKPANVVTAQTQAEIVRAATVTADNAQAPRGEAARVHRDANGTAWVEFV